MSLTITEANDGSTIVIDKALVIAVYEQEIYRQIVMQNGTTYDASDTFESLAQSIAGGGIT